MNKITVGISGAIILLLLSGAVVSFSQNNQSINHPYKLFFERRISQFSTFPVSRDSIVFLGDSLIDEGRWEEMFPNAKTVNRGVLADRTEHIIARLDQVIKGQPDMIFIMVGTNDLKSGIKRKTIISNYRNILESIKNQSPATKVFVQSLLPREAKFQKRIEKINNELLLLSQESGYTYIDLYSAFLDNDGALKGEYSNDGLHLLGTGYLKWREIIEPYIGGGKIM